LTFFALIAEVGASRGAAFTYVNPAVSVLLGVVLLSESFNLATILGFLLIILGSWLSTGGNLPSRLRLAFQRRQPPAEPLLPTQAFAESKETGGQAREL
jgi:drug/metabolite transporter (DMT)-like permease